MFNKVSLNRAFNNSFHAGQRCNARQIVVLDLPRSSELWQPLCVQQESSLCKSFIHVPKKLFANAGHQYLHPFHQVVVQLDIVPRWSHGRLEGSFS